ncbi:MAG: endonuclease [Streptosporangiales bacterium]|nr:endonuclease [Streptosporangiales bacterium]
MVVVGTWNLENLYRPGGGFGPDDDAAYEAKLSALADTINRLAPDVLGVQEIGDPEALADLIERLKGKWGDPLLSEHPDGRGIRVGVLSRFPATVLSDVVDFRPEMPPLRADDSGAQSTRMGRGALAVRVKPARGKTLDVAVCHLKSKLLTFPGGRFNPRDEAERARYGAYALNRRAAEAATVRGLADDLIDGKGEKRAVVVLGDLNDEPQAATTQILLGPPGSELGTAAASRSDQGDAWRLWNLAPLLPDDQRYSRVHRDRPELIDHILVSHALLGRVEEVHSEVGGKASGEAGGKTSAELPSIGNDPGARRGEPGSDHAPILARLAL